MWIGEVAETKIVNYTDGIKNDCTNEESISLQMSEVEKELAKENVVIRIIGKCALFCINIDSRHTNFLSARKGQLTLLVIGFCCFFLVGH